MTRPSPLQFASAMLEGSFMALLWLSAFALITRDPHVRELALAAIAAVSLAIAVILVLPRRWLAPTPDVPTSLAEGVRLSAKADVRRAPTLRRTVQAPSLSGASPTPSREPGHEL